ncbi:hypothetical protein C8N43_1865 [Litoreibacter ponti]|uniref:Lipoprotein n=1 Tax=Litoreibacter ponti TaxID=1510457 RepID=A0A2T6BMB5_9RHOB|nr:hypothetical protein [Litoreibacter ponti]PTX57199.1 hypothetical protein C8N43_1865 [Litoreibacter ponti]
MDRRLFVMSGLGLAVSACAPGPLEGPAPTADVDALAAGLMALRSDVAASEAARAARLSYSHTAALAEAYRITDGPIIHNRKVNRGERPRGLCRHWAEDMSTRLAQEGFTTLDVTRAIANADNPFRLEHSTTVLTPRGAAMEDGMVIDPWRLAGRLHWDTVRQDTRYKWRPRAVVLEEKRQKLLAEMGRQA